MKLLYIDCCISIHEVSRTQLLADAFLDAWQKVHPLDEIETLDLKAAALQPLLGQALAEREALLDAHRVDAPSFALARQFARADRIVIAAPYWELSFPAQLRLYIEQISALNITFGYTENGQSAGLCKADKLLFLTTAGGPIEGANYGGDYLRAMCGVYGIGQFEFLGAPMQDVREIDHEAILNETLLQARELALTF